MELNRKVSELKGIKSLRALNAYCALMIGLKMLPAYAHLSLEDFFKLVEAMPPEDQLIVLTNGAKIVELDPEEVKALIYFCSDKNGVPYTDVNFKNMGPSELVEVIVAVCMSIMKDIHIDLITRDEKKNSNPSQLMSVEPS